MSNHYKPKTKINTIHEYRKYIVPKDCDEVVVISQEDEWSPIPYDISSPASYWYRYNHPLVNDGEAYWLNKTRLCTGYTIGNVFRPIFNYSREEKAYEIRKYMTTIAKISAAQSREHLYKQELMKLHNKKIPTELVEHIANYAWDIMLLL